MKIFTRKEIIAFLTYSNPELLINDNRVSLINLICSLHIDITVDELRKIIGIGNHSDPISGSKYLWETEEDIPSTTI